MKQLTVFELIERFVVNTGHDIQRTRLRLLGRRRRAPVLAVLPGRVQRPEPERQRGIAIRPNLNQHNLNLSIFL